MKRQRTKSGHFIHFTSVRLSGGHDEHRPRQLRLPFRVYREGNLKDHRQILMDALQEEILNDHGQILWMLLNESGEGFLLACLSALLKHPFELRVLAMWAYRERG